MIVPNRPRLLLHGVVLALLGMHLLSTSVLAGVVKYVMMPDPTTDALVLFNPVDGSLLDPDLFTLSGGAPNHAVQIDNEIWVCEQTGDRISRWTLDGNFLGQIGPTFSGSGLDNVIALSRLNDSVYAVNLGTDNSAPGKAVVEFDTAGTFIDSFPTSAASPLLSPFGILAHQNELLVSSLNADYHDIHRFSVDGTSLGAFLDSTTLDYVYQLSHGANGIVLAAFDGKIARLDPDSGAVIDTFDVFPGAFGVFQLEDGNILWSAGDGVRVLDVNTGQSTSVYSGNGRYLALLEIDSDPPEPCLPDVASSFLYYWTDRSLSIPDNREVWEFTAAGDLVREHFTVPHPGGYNVAEDKIRDLIVDRNGNIQIYNGTFDPYLSTWDPGTGTWQHNLFAGWNTISNVTFGGLDTWESYVFATDMVIGDEPSDSNGIIRFDTQGSFAAQRFTIGFNYIDVTVGGDGKLYALDEFFRVVDIFELPSMNYLGFTVLGSSSPEHNCRAIAVDDGGHIYGAGRHGTIWHFDSKGAVADSIDSTLNNCDCIDLNADGQLILCHDETVAITDTALSCVRTVQPLCNPSPGCALRARVIWMPETTVPGDLDGNGSVDVFDLFQLLNNWGSDGAGADLAEPFDIVDVFDLFVLLGNWGA